MVSGYTQLIVNHIVFANGDGKTTPKSFYLDPVSFTPEENRYWRGELIGIYFAISDKMTIAKSHSSWKNRASCPGKYGRPCDYTTLCNDYDPDTKGKNADLLYHIKEGWKPW